jgi:hypothetical protein
MSFHYTRRGIGDVSYSQVGSVGTSAANIVALDTSSAPTSTMIEGSVGGALLAAAPFAGPAAPFLAAAGAIAELLAKFGVGSGCGQSCVLSTQYANAAESALQQNIAAYFAIPPPRWTGYQQQAISNFMSVWNDLDSQCSNPSLGTAGQNCISDRQSGACKWHQTTTPPWGTPEAGACWNWWNGYHDPIANDPDVTDVQPGSLSSAANSVSNVASSLVGDAGSSPILWVVGAAIVGWLVMK